MKKLILLLVLLGVISSMSVLAAWTLKGTGDNMYMYDLDEDQKEVRNPDCLGDGYNNYYYTKTKVCVKPKKPLNYYYTKTTVCTSDEEPISYYYTSTRSCCDTWLRS